MAQPVHIVAVTAIILRNNKILILKRHENEIAFPGLWTIPGGKVEIGDTVSQTLVREVEEETGLKVVGTPMYAGDGEFTRPDNIHVVALRFACEVGPGEPKHSDDFTDMAWVGPDELDNYEIIPSVKKELAAYFSEKGIK